VKKITSAWESKDAGTEKKFGEAWQVEPDHDQLQARKKIGEAWQVEPDHDQLQARKKIGEAWQVEPDHDQLQAIRILNKCTCTWRGESLRFHFKACR
jgi:hypothetical protein